MIQFRYGWTDEVVNNLLFSRFSRLVKLSLKANQEGEKERLVLAAFVGWQMGAAGQKTLGQYLCDLGLSSEPIQASTPHGSLDDTEALRGMGIEVKKVKK